MSYMYTANGRSVPEVKLLGMTTVAKEEEFGGRRGGGNKDVVLLVSRSDLEFREIGCWVLE